MPVSAANSTVSASPSSVDDDWSSISTITVTLKDGSNAAVPGKNVSLSAGSGHSFVYGPNGVSDASGHVKFYVVNGYAQTCVYTATDTDDAITITQTASITFTARTTGTGLIPSARLANWTPGTRVGVPGGYEQYLVGGASERTDLIDVTQSPYSADKTGVSDSSTAINSALAAATSGQVVYLPTGTYKINSTLYMQVSGTTLRGDGHENTILDVHAGTGIAINGDPSWGNQPLFHPFSTIASGLTANSTSLVVDDPTGNGNVFTIGPFANISWLDDPALPVISVQGYKAIRSVVVKVTNVSGSTITFSPPLPATFPNATGATIEQTQATALSLVGLEDLYIQGNGTDMQYGTNYGMSYGCWKKNIKVSGHQHYGIWFTASVLPTVTYCYVTPSGGGSNHSGFLFDYSTAALVYDNIIENNFPLMEINGNTGFVFAYNFATSASIGIDTNHGAHNSFMLYEGNIVANFLSDSYFGSESEHTIFRNWVLASAPDDTELWSVAYKRMNRNHSIVGNIIQKSGVTTTSDGMSFGQPNIGNSNYIGICWPSQGIYWRDWNSDGTTPYSGTLTTRTDATHGVVTLSSGTAAFLDAPYRPSSQYGELVDHATGAVITAVDLISHSGNTVTIDSTPYGVNLPALNTAVDVWGGPTGFQELDLDVISSTIRRENYYYFYGAIPPGEAKGSDTLADSLYLSGTPDWFLGLAWPPFDPTSVGTPSYEQIPAGYRYVNGVDPGGSPPVAVVISGAPIF